MTLFLRKHNKADPTTPYNLFAKIKAFEYFLKHCFVIQQGYKYRYIITLDFTKNSIIMHANKIFQNFLNT